MKHRNNKSNHVGHMNLTANLLTEVETLYSEKKTTKKAISGLREATKDLIVGSIGKIS